MALIKCKECGREVSEQADKCPHCGAPVKKKSSGCALLFAIVAGVALVGYIASLTSGGGSTSDPSPRPSAQEDKPQLPQQKTSLPSFTLLKDGSYEKANTAKVIWAILVPSDVTKESLTNLLHNLYSQAQSRKFKEHAGATVIDIKAYMTRQHFESGMGQWIGWMSKSGGQSQPSLSLDDRQINQLGMKAEEKFGLPEDKRKEIWQEAVRAEDRANKEAEQMYPEPSPQNRDAFMAAFEKREQLSKQLLNEYRDELAKNYNITSKQLTEITREGSQKSWPFPK